MTVSFKAPVKSAVVNNAFVSKQADDTKVGKLGLNKASEGGQVFSVQKSVNELFDVSGTGEGDPNAKVYSNENFITSGDSQKTAIEKLDAQVKNNSDTIQDHINEAFGAHQSTAISYNNTVTLLLADNAQEAIDVVHDRLVIAEDDIQAIEDSIGQPNGITPLNGSAKIDSTYLPSYVDDVLEFADLASFPVTGETGKIYVAIDTNKTYRWTGTVYVEVSPSEVTSVNGYNGVIVLDADDIAETNTRYWAKKSTVTGATPTASNDSTEFYSIGSQWYDTSSKALFICEDASAGVAIWEKVSGEGGGGGASSLKWTEGDVSPIKEYVDGFDFFTFSDNTEQSIFATITVPDSYVLGNQIKLTSGSFFVNDSSGDVLIKSSTALLSSSFTLGTYSNIHASTNLEVATNATPNRINTIGEIDLTSSIGEINSTPVQIGDKLRIRIFRDFSNETSSATDTRLMVDSFELKFS